MTLLTTNLFKKDFTSANMYEVSNAALRVPHGVHHQYSGVPSPPWSPLCEYRSVPQRAPSPHQRLRRSLEPSESVVRMNPADYRSFRNFNPPNSETAETSETSSGEPPFWGPSETCSGEDTYLCTLQGGARDQLPVEHRDGGARVRPRRRRRLAAQLGQNVLNPLEHLRSSSRVPEPYPWSTLGVPLEYPWRSRTVPLRRYVRKKAVLVLYKLFLKFPKALRPSFPRLKEKLDDREVGA